MEDKEHTVDIDTIFEKDYPAITIEDGNNFKTTIHICKEIEGPEKFIEILSVINSAEEGDTIIFNLNTPGGRSDTTIMLLDALDDCKALLIGKVSGEVASAGTMLLMAMDEIQVATWGNLMIHNYSQGMFGKGGEIAKRMKFEIPHLSKMYHSLYSDFLTEEEIDTVVNDGDIYCDKQDILIRWSNVIKTREALAKEHLDLEQEKYIEDLVTQAKNVLMEYGPVNK
jgi:ATP-dependent protease ClpP protease subunit